MACKTRRTTGSKSEQCNGTETLSNTVIRERCIDLFKVLVENINYPEVMDTLLAERVLTHESVQQLKTGGTSVDCCRRLLLMLLSSKHPTAFIVLRQALASRLEYSYLVTMIDTPAEENSCDTYNKVGDQLDQEQEDLGSPADWNRRLKKKFRTMLKTLVDSIPISPVLDHLTSVRVIKPKTRGVVTLHCNGCSPGPQAYTCWSRLMKELCKKKRNPRTFIELREALVDDYAWFVEGLDSLNDKEPETPPNGRFVENTLKRMKLIIRQKTDDTLTVIRRGTEDTLTVLRRSTRSGVQLSKMDISQPSDCRRVFRMHWDDQAGFKMDIGDPAIKECVEAMLKAIGLKSFEIKDEKTAMFVSIFVHQSLCMSPSILDNNFQLVVSSPEILKPDVTFATVAMQKQRHDSDTAAAGYNSSRRNHVIQTTILLVQGIALLMGVVYIACGKTSYIMAYDACIPDKKIGEIEIPGLEFAWDLVACPKFKCLFLTDFTNDCVWRINPFPVQDTTTRHPAATGGSRLSRGGATTHNKDVVKGDISSSSGCGMRRERLLPCNPRIERFVRALGEPWTLSVSEDGELFQIWTDGSAYRSVPQCIPAMDAAGAQCACDEDIGSESTVKSPTLLIFDRHGQLSWATTLSEQVDYPHHVIKSSRNTFYVSHGMENGLHRVCELSPDGKEVLRSYGDRAGVRPGQLNLPWHMAANERGDVFVVDRGNARVVLLDVELTRILLSIHQDWVDRPWRLCYIPSSHEDCRADNSDRDLVACARTRLSGRLLVGTYTGVVNSYSIELFD